MNKIPIHQRKGAHRIMASPELPALRQPAISEFCMNRRALFGTPAGSSRQQFLAERLPATSQLTNGTVHATVRLGLHPNRVMF